MARTLDEVISDLPLDQRRNIAERTAQLIEEEMTPRDLREEVMAGHTEYLANPSNGVAAEDILSRIKARRVVRAGELTDEEVALIASAEVPAEHAHLDEIQGDREP